MASTDVEITLQSRAYKYSLRDRIGRGAFGDVYKGIVDNVSFNDYDLESCEVKQEKSPFEIISIATEMIFEFNRANF